jgi:phosphoribosylformylglycinamidine cyclo-ligase
MLPDGIVARVHKDSYPVLPIFKLMQKKGELEEKMMYNTFNMGIGMVLAVDSADAEKTIAALKNAGEDAYLIGETVSGDEKGVELC